MGFEWAELGEEKGVGREDKNIPSIQEMKEYKHEGELVTIVGTMGRPIRLKQRV